MYSDRALPGIPLLALDCGKTDIYQSVANIRSFNPTQVRNFFWYGMEEIALSLLL